MPADVLIAGAGIVGASIALQLAKAALAVEILDASRFGGEASWAGAGMLAPGAEFTDPGPWTSLALKSLARYPGYVGELTDETGISIDHRRCGALELAFNEREWIALGARAARQAALGIRSEPLTPAVAASLAPGIPTAALLGARHYLDDAIVDPRDILRALRRALAARGVPIHEFNPVTALNATAAGVEVVTPAGSKSARAAVIAAGAWSSAIRIVVDSAARVLPAAIPARGHLLGWLRVAAKLGVHDRRQHRGTRRIRPRPGRRHRR
jgi:glycine/D-amino acid oxidase-like deaminating enzyme